MTLVFSSAASKLNYFVEHASLVVSAPGRSVNSAIEMTIIIIIIIIITLWNLSSVRALRLLLPGRRSTVLNFTSMQPVDAVLCPTFVHKLCYKLSSVVTFYIHTDFWSKFCLIYWTASKLPRLLDTASKFALLSVSGLKDEKLIKKTNLHENWNMQTQFYRLLNISAKYHQNRSLQFRAIPFQSWAVFWDTVYNYVWYFHELCTCKFVVSLFSSMPLKNK